MVHAPLRPHHQTPPGDADPSLRWRGLERPTLIAGMTPRQTPNWWPAGGAEMELEDFRSRRPRGWRPQADLALCLARAMPHFVPQRLGRGRPLGFTPEQLQRDGPTRCFPKAECGGSCRRARVKGMPQVIAPSFPPAVRHGRSLRERQETSPRKARVVFYTSTAPTATRMARGGTATIDLRGEADLKRD